jgi:hypothetical protein
LRDFASGIECRTVTSAVKRMVALRFEFALLVCAIRGKDGQFPGLPNHEEPEITEPIVQAVGGIIAKRTGIYHLLRVP